MCNAPIRAYYVFDTKAPNKHRQFYFLYGTLSINKLF